MDPSRPAEAPSATPETLEFVRFCYRRRRVGWPELYDEMCAVAGRGLYRGWRFEELETHGIGFSLDQTLELARVAGQVAREEGDRRGREATPAGTAVPADVDGGSVGARTSALPTGSRVRDEERSFDVRIVTSDPIVEPAASHETHLEDAEDRPPTRVAVPMDAPPSGRLGTPPAGPTMTSSLVTSAVVAG